MLQTEAKVLILDDDPVVTELLSDILQQDGYRVMASNSSKDVLYLAKQFMPDLLLLDIMMPEVDGYDVCEFFKKDPELKLTKIVILSARDTQDSRIRCYKARCDAFISKPFELAELREIINTQVISKRSVDQLLNELLRQTTMDDVVNCYNRKYMEKRIAQELLRVDRYKRPFSLLLMDVDNFKNINVRYGYDFGNEVLRDVTEALRLELRECDLLGRYREDSFIILLPETARSGAKIVARRLQETISSMVFLKKKRLSLRASIGVTVVDAAKLKVEDALKAVEDELHKVVSRKLGRTQERQ